jgi:SAM-dependent methyltransferase
VSDTDAGRLAGESLENDDPTGWFERLYEAADAGRAQVPWDREVPNQLLVDWAAGMSGEGRRALVVGCGYGADAEFVSGLGFETVAFDIAPSAIAGARRRFPESAVDYRTADLLDLPADWRQAFGFVMESITVQALPPALHPEASAAVAGVVGPGGTLLVISGARPEDERPDGPPWPLSRSELDAFAVGGLESVRIERVSHPRERSVPMWRAELRRPPD